MNDSIEEAITEISVSNHDVKTVSLTEKKDTSSSDEVIRYVAVLFQTGGRPDGDINYRSVRKLRQLLDKTIESHPEQTEIDIWIESPGGDIDAAYKLAIALRAHCKTLRAVVPDFAKSAATLVALAADEIIMDPSAELGPLDAQVNHPDREDERISALDIAETLSQLARIGIAEALSCGAELMRTTGLTRKDSLKFAIDYVQAFLGTVTGKIDPSIVHNAANQLRVAEMYGALLLRRQIQARPNTADKLKELPKKLVRDYPSHSFVIDLEHAQELGLNAFGPEKYDMWETANRLCQNFELDNRTSIMKVLKADEIQSLEDFEE